MTDVLDAGYFRIQVDAFNRVRQLTCLTKQVMHTSLKVAAIQNDAILHALIRLLSDEAFIRYCRYCHACYFINHIHCTLYKYGAIT